MSNNQKMNELIDEFNSVLVDFIKNIAIVCPQSIIADNLKYIEGIYNDIVSGKNNDFSKECFIKLFMKHVLVYQDKIKSGDESYFLADHCYKDIKNTNFMDKIFHFKDLWKSLKQENKDIVIDYMSYLCDICQDYFDILDSNGEFN